LLEWGAIVDDKSMKKATENNNNNNNNNNKENAKKIFDLLELVKQFDDTKDKRQFIKDYEKDDIKDENCKMPYSAKAEFMLHARLRNSKEEREKTLFGVRMPEKYKDAKFDITQDVFLKFNLK
jgi:hypothetical protein